MTTGPTSTDPSTTRLPCAGITVVEFASMVSGPFAGLMLRDLGARVIKVELPTGDPLRWVKPMVGDIGSQFLQHNGGKESIALDLKSDSGREIAVQLASRADVLITNFRPGVMERLGLGYDDLKLANPGLIYMAITGFGGDGPYAARPAYDHVLQGLSGIMRPFGDGPPQPIRNVIVDKVTALTAANGIVSALLLRERDGGGGQRLETSLLDCFTAFYMPEMLTDSTFLSPDAPRAEWPNIFCPLQTRDGYVIGHVHIDSQFVGICQMFDREDLLTDPRYNTPAERYANLDLMWAEFESAALRMTTAEVLAAAHRHSVPLGPVNTADEFIDDPQVQHNQTLVIVNDEMLGEVRTLRSPVRFDGRQADVRGRPPRLNEHADRIMASLGFSEEEGRPGNEVEDSLVSATTAGAAMADVRRDV